VLVFSETVSTHNGSDINCTARVWRGSSFSCARVKFHYLIFVFDDFQYSGIIDSFRTAGNRLLLAFDVTQYFSAQKLHSTPNEGRYKPS